MTTTPTTPVASASTVQADGLTPGAASELQADGLLRVLVEALRAAREFIDNGRENNYITMPRSGDDPAHKTPALIEGALCAYMHYLRHTPPPQETPAPVTAGAQREAVAELIKAARAMIRSSDAVADSANIGLMDEPIAYLTAVCNYIEQMPASPQQQMQVTDKMVEAAKAVYDDGEWSIGHRLAREMIEAAIRVRP